MDVHLKYAPKEPARAGEWYVNTFTLDDGSVVRFQVGERDEADYVVMLLHHKKEMTPEENRRGLTYVAAHTRVDRSPRLRKYKSIILSAGYASDDDHLRWVVSARVGEIEAWAQQIKEDSDE
jgi:hypothetical protein